MKQHFENLSETLRKLHMHQTRELLNKKLDIKLGAFTQEELDSVVKKLTIKKKQGLMK